MDAWREQYGELVTRFRIAHQAQRSIGAIAAWMRKAELDASTLHCEPFDRGGFRQALTELRALTTEPDPAVFVPRLQSTCARHDVAVVFVPTPAQCLAYGATRWVGSDKALVQLSLRYKTNDALWFTFFHESAHILLHGKKRLFLEDWVGTSAGSAAGSGGSSSRGSSRSSSKSYSGCGARSIADTPPARYTRCVTTQPSGSDHDMNALLAKLLEEALALPPEARAALAGSLLDSLDDSVDPGAEAAWEQEISRRLQELQSGKVTPIPWSQARRSIMGSS